MKATDVIGIQMIKVHRHGSLCKIIVQNYLKFKIEEL